MGEFGCYLIIDWPLLLEVSNLHILEFYKEELSYLFENYREESTSCSVTVLCIYNNRKVRNYLQ